MFFANIAVSGAENRKFFEWEKNVNPQNAKIGYAFCEFETCGGEGGEIVRANTPQELEKALSLQYPAVIKISRDILFKKAIRVKGISDKTIESDCGASLVCLEKDRGILAIHGGKNIVIRNLKFVGGGSSGNEGEDNLSLSNCKYVWIDHCEFSDGADGNLDCNKGSDFLSITFCRFFYQNSGNHSFSNLWGSSNSEIESEGRLRTTFAFCRWEEGCVERMPRARFGKIHIANCLYDSKSAKYCIGAHFKSKILCQNSVFSNIKKPSRTAEDGLLCFENCLFENTPNVKFSDKNFWTADYDFIPPDVKRTKEIVLDAKYGAGIFGDSKKNAAK